VTLLADALALPPPERARLLQAALAGSASRPSAYRPPRRPPPLPAPAAALIGRATEVGEACALLDPAPANMRLLTLLGPGGVGKTRLALAIAAGLQDVYPDGVAFVDLAPLREPGLVAATVADALQLPKSGARSGREVLIEHLRDRQVLLVLDNYEHMLITAPLLADLLAGCPRLALLVTSRVALHVRAERRLFVEPLALPAAVRLFVECARRVAPTFCLTDVNADALAAVCRRLDCLPLALELAAPHAGLLEPEALLRRLEHRLPLLTGGPADLPDRQQTLRHTLAWSHDLLAADEQILFRRLGVFAGGWTLDAAEVVCGGVDLAGAEVLDRLRALVDNSLVQQTSGADGARRFGMLDTIREYAAERLAESGEFDELRRRHARHYLVLAEQAGVHWDAPGQGRSAERLQTEHNNLRLALDWARLGSCWELGLRIAGALSPFWWLQGHFREGADRLEDLHAGAATADAAARPTGLVQARALLGAARLHAELGDGRAALDCEASVALLRGVDEPNLLAQALNSLAMIRRRQGELAAAESVLEEVLALVQQQDQPGAVAATLINLGTLAHWQGAFDRATGHVDQALHLSAQLQDRRGMTFARIRLASLAVEQGMYDRADELARLALEDARDLGQPREESFALLVEGRAARCRGDTSRAVERLELSLQLAAELGHASGGALAQAMLALAHQDLADHAAASACGDAALVLAQGDVGTWPALVAHVSRGQVAVAQADWTRAEAELGAADALGARCATTWGRPTCLEGLAELALQQRDNWRAACLLGAATRLRDQQTGAPAAG
jgi:predicted ATPase